MDSMDFQLRLKPIMDVSDISTNLKSVQSYLDKLKVPNKLRSEFSETFSKAEKEVEKIQDTLNKKTKTKGDVTGLEKSFTNVDKYFNKIVADMNKLSGKKIFDSSQFKTSEITQVTEQIKTLQTAIKEKIPTSSITQVNSAIKEMGTVSKSVSLERFREAFKSGDYNTAAKELNNLKANLIQFQNTEKKATYSQGLEKLETAFKELNGGDLIESTQQLQNLQNILNSLTAERMEELNNSYEKNCETVKELAENTRKVGNEIVTTTSKQEEMNNQLSQLKDRAKYFFSLTNAVQLFRRALRDAFETMKELDSTMAETAVVTNFSIGDMWNKLPQYTQIANQLGVSIQDVYEAQTLYYQQGLKTNEVIQVSNETLKMARIAGMDAADATDRMTSALRGFNMEINEESAQRINDVYSELAAITASDVDEISQAMTKTASIAANAGMEFETTSAFLAQMLETTREAPEQKKILYIFY